MPHPNQQAQQVVPPAVEEPQRDGHRTSNGHRSSDGHPRSNGHARSHGKGQVAPFETEMHLVDVAALLAENEGLRQRLASQPVIEQAKGMLMGYYGISSDSAFQLLCRWSKNTNTKLRRIAELLTDSATHHASRRPAPHQIVQQNLPSPGCGDLAQSQKD
jgi:hypothetical protein